MQFGFSGVFYCADLSKWGVYSISLTVSAHFQFDVSVALFFHWCQKTFFYWFFFTWGCFVFTLTGQAESGINNNPSICTATSAQSTSTFATSSAGFFRPECVELRVEQRSNRRLSAYVNSPYSDESKRVHCAADAPSCSIFYFFFSSSAAGAGMTMTTTVTASTHTIVNRGHIMATQCLHLFAIPAQVEETLRPDGLVQKKIKIKK